MNAKMPAVDRDLLIKELEIKYINGIRGNKISI